MNWPYKLEFLHSTSLEMPARNKQNSLFVPFIIYEEKKVLRIRRHGAQYNYTEHNDIQHNDTQHNGFVCDIQHNNNLYCFIRLSLC